MHAIIFIGIQGAGKTTFYLQNFFHSHLRISLDVVKSRRREAILVRACLEARQPFVIDNTNITIADRARYLLPAHTAGFRISGYFFEPDPHGSWRRNQRREGRHRVPAAGLFGTLKRLEPPTWDEGFDELFRVHLADVPFDFSVEPL